MTTSENVRLAILRKLCRDAAQGSRRLAVPRARARGVVTDEEVFRHIECLARGR